MFNTTVNKNIVSTHINAVTGQISKTYRESFFVRFHLKSRTSDNLLSLKPTYREEYNVYDVQVIQIVICGDMEAIAEIIKKSDYDKILDER